MGKNAVVRTDYTPLSDEESPTTSALIENDIL